MTRKIEFAFWNKQKKEMWSVQSVDWRTREVCNGGDIASLNDGVLLQYTGLKDKNGKEIFEGDIVKARNVGLCEVVFEYGAFYLSSPSFAGLLLLHHYVLDCEVIGNVYEHKYLLKEGE